MNELTNQQLYTVTKKRITGVNIHSGKEAFGALVSCDPFYKRYDSIYVTHKFQWLFIFYMIEHK